MTVARKHDEIVHIILNVCTLAVVHKNVAVYIKLTFCISVTGNKCEKQFTYLLL